MIVRVLNIGISKDTLLIMSYMFTCSEEGTHHLSVRSKLYGACNGWKCCTRSGFELCYPCVSNGANLGSKVNFCLVVKRIVV